jgi:regulator of ribonuclease activity B
MNWTIVFVLLVGAAAVYKIVSSIRKNRELHDQDWDTKLITELRKRGQDPFQPHDVDFFFALPSEAACTAINRALEAEGFRVDVKAVPDNKEFPYSLHATKNMRVHGPDMKELSRRFAELARTQAGRYDGWGAS